MGLFHHTTYSLSWKESGRALPKKNAAHRFALHTKSTCRILAPTVGSASYVNSYLRKCPHRFILRSVSRQHFLNWISLLSHGSSQCQANKNLSNTRVMSLQWASQQITCRLNSTGHRKECRKAANGCPCSSGLRWNAPCRPTHSYSSSWWWCCLEEIVKLFGQGT